MNNNNPTPKGPVLRASLRANAEPFTPSGFASVHASQPSLGRRHTQNPTYVHTTPKKRNSVHGNMRRAGGAATQDQNNPPAEKMKATTFSHDAFAKKGAAKTAAKAYAARKRAALMDKSAPDHHRKADAARKGFERRQSIKNAKKAAAAATVAQENSVSSADITDDNSKQNLPTKQLVQDVVERVIDLNLNDAPTNSTVSSAPSSRPSSTTSIPNDSSAKPQSSIDAMFSNLSDAVVEERPVVKEKRMVAPAVAPPSTPSLSIETVSCTAIEPPAMVPRSTPASSGLITRNSLSTLPSLSVDIGSMNRNTSAAMSSCTMSTMSGDSYGRSQVKKSRETTMPSSGKWCDECAGVGLHIAAMMTTMASWRADEERRESNSSSSGNSCNTKKGGWTRRMSQTFIGTSTSTTKSSNTSEVVKDKQRLQQQVDVLQLTVNFLYDKLQHHDAVTPEIAAMVRRLA